MTRDQLMAVKRRAIGQDPSDAWYDIFKILFPGTTLPLRPYPTVESGHLFTVNKFWSFLDSEAQGLLIGDINCRLRAEGEALLERSF